MAGRGPAPTDPSERRRRNKNDAGTTVMRWETVDAPALPDFRIERDGQLVEFVWPERTREWWQMWIDSPQADLFGASDWDFLLDTAVIHARFWRGDASAAAELRLRVAKFGATPEDRARLKIATTGSGKSSGGMQRKPAAKSRKERVLKVVGDDQ